MAYTTDFQQRNQSYKESVRNLRDLTQELANQATGITLFNPSDRVIVGRLSGQPRSGVGSVVPRTFRIPPEGMVLNTHSGKLEPRDGTLVVYDDVRQDPEQLRNWRDGRKGWDSVPKPSVTFHTAAEVAAHLVRQNEHLGLCYLTGTPEEREAQKTAARMRFLGIRKNEAQGKVAAAHKKAADAKALGMSYQWSDDEVRSQDYLNSVAKDEGEGRIHCRFKCGYWHYDAAQMEKHVEMQHATELAGEIAAVQAAERVETEEKRGRRKSA